MKRAGQAGLAFFPAPKGTLRQLVSSEQELERGDACGSLQGYNNLMNSLYPMQSCGGSPAVHW